MTLLLQKEINRLRSMIVTLSGVVEEAFNKAVSAFIHKDIALAKAVIAGDERIDAMEIELEEECLKLLALHQPVAIDLRYVVACLKINNDLERIGDLAAKSAKRVKAVAKSKVEVDFDFLAMMNRTQAMLQQSLNSILNMDCELARKVCDADTEVDNMKKEAGNVLSSIIKEDPKNSEFYLQFLGLTRDIERIADYATNIAEDVIYMIEGKIIRHIK